MAKAGSNQGFAARLWDEAPKQPPLDWRRLGTSIRRLPPPYWEERMFFHGADDRKLRDATGGFPATFRSHKKTHPLFVLKRLANFGFQVCPCTSLPSSPFYIEKGCLLEPSEYAMERTSYIMERFRFGLPRSGNVNFTLRFMGVVPESCLRRSP